MIIFFTEYSELATSTISQRSSVHYTGSWQLLHYLLTTMYGSVEVVLADGTEGDISEDSKILRVFGVINVIYEQPMVTIEVCIIMMNDNFYRY